MLLCGLHCESNRTEESLMVLTHIYEGQNSVMKMFMWVYVTGTPECPSHSSRTRHIKASSSGLLHHSCRHTRSLHRCCHTVALTMIQSEPDLESIITERPPLFVPTENNFSGYNKQVMNSTDLSEIKEAVIYIMHLHFLDLKHHAFVHQK